MSITIRHRYQQVAQYMDRPIAQYALIIRDMLLHVHLMDVLLFGINTLHRIGDHWSQSLGMFVFCI